MKQQIIFSILLGLQLICQHDMLYAQDLGTHRAYKITSYVLGDIADYEAAESPTSLQNATPLMITGTTTDILASEYAPAASLGDPESRPSTIKSIALGAEFDATDKISLQAAIGVTRNVWSPDLSGNMNGAWEANLGVIYKLLDNISYELHFGYMDTGDLYNNRSSYSDVESIIMLNNRLTLSF